MTKKISFGIFVKLRTRCLFKKMQASYLADHKELDTELVSQDRGLKDAKTSGNFSCIIASDLSSEKLWSRFYIDNKTLCHVFLSLTIGKSHD